MGRRTGAPWGTGHRLGVEVDQDLPDPCRRGPLRGPCPQRAPGGQFGSRGRQRSVAGLRTGSPSSGLRVRPGAAAAIREHDRGRAQPFDLAVGDASDEDPRRAQALADIAVIALLQHGVAGAPWRRKPSVSRALQARSVIEGAKGVLAESGNLGMDEAYVRLRGYAAGSGATLTEVAEQPVGGQLAGHPSWPGEAHRSATGTACPDRSVRPRPKPGAALLGGRGGLSAAPRLAEGTSP